MNEGEYNLANPDASRAKTTEANRFDIFICGGNRHIAGLERLLPMAHPHGHVHLASITLDDDNLRRLRPWHDTLHVPRHDADGYNNFAAFCVEDIDRLATAPHFIKLDADIHLEPDWIDYARRAVASLPEAALIGPFAGVSPLNLDLDGPEIRRRFGGAISVANRPKIRGGFYIGRTEVFHSVAQDMRAILQTVREFQKGTPGVSVEGALHRLPDHPPEDVIRNLALYATGHGDLIAERPCRGEIRLHPSETRPALEKAG